MRKAENDQTILLPIGVVIGKGAITPRQGRLGKTPVNPITYFAPNLWDGR